MRLLSLYWKHRFIIYSPTIQSNLFQLLYWIMISFFWAHYLLNKQHSIQYSIQLLFFLYHLLRFDRCCISTYSMSSFACYGGRILINYILVLWQCILNDWFIFEKKSAKFFHNLVDISWQLIPLYKLNRVINRHWLYLRIPHRWPFLVPWINWRIGVSMAFLFRVSTVFSFFN